MWTVVVKLLVMLAVLLCPACATLPSQIASDATHVVAVKCARLPARMPWYSTHAEHGWYDVKTESGWHRVEVMGSMFEGADAFTVYQQDLQWFLLVRSLQ